MRLTGGENPHPDQETKHGIYEAYKEELESLTQQMGAYIARKTGTKSGEATFEGLGLGGCCVPISPADDRQPIPEALQGIDDGGWE